MASIGVHAHAQGQAGSQLRGLWQVPLELQKRVEHGLRQQFQQDSPFSSFFSSWSRVAQELSFSVAPKILSNLSPRGP